MKEFFTKSRYFTQHVYDEWSEDGTLRVGASIAYYGIIAIIPFVFLMLFFATIVFSPQQVIDFVINASDNLISGVINASKVKDLEIYNFTQNSAEIPSSIGIVGLVSFIVTASLFVVALQDALNVIWKSKKKLKFSIRRYLISFIVMMTAAITFSVYLGLRVIIQAIESFFVEDGIVVSTIFDILSAVAAFSVLVLLNMILYKALIKVSLDIKSLFLSAVITTLLSFVGLFGIAIYIGNFVNFTYYGALSSFFVVAIAIYYFAQIFLVGAQISKVLSYREGNKFLKPYLEKTDPRPAKLR